ncbi:unnamed protein product [Boreogadus saida]
MFIGVIVTARKFDRERQREYAVTVTATDQATDPLIGICQLNILILDHNDNSPKFENLRYEYFLREDTMIGTSFLRVAAITMMTLAPTPQSPTPCPMSSQNTSGSTL